MLRIKRIPWLYQSIIAIVCCVLIIIGSGLPTRANETLRVATEPTFPPFEMRDKDGNLVGFDIDIMNALGEEAGFNIEWVTLPFDGIVPALQVGQVDAAISGMTITPERAQTVAFSRPYFKSGLAIAVREGNEDINSFEDLEGKRIAVQIGTTGAIQSATIPGAIVSNFDSSVFALQELVNGNVDAVVNDAPVTLFAIKETNLQGIKIAGEFVTEEYYGIAFPFNSPNVERINQAIETLITNGRYQEIYEAWFGVAPPTLPEVAPTLLNADTQVTNNLDWARLLPNFLIGALVTLQITAVATFVGMIGGVIIAVIRKSKLKILRMLAKWYVDFFRGTPLLVQLFMIYFGLPALLQGMGLNLTLGRFPAAIAALGMNAAAYLSEIIRGGIDSVDPGQLEAAECLGMNPTQAMSYVIFPQAFRRMIPPLGNEFITLLKDTSLVAVIGYEELFRRGQLAVAVTFRAFEIYAAIALIYLILNLLSSRFFSFLEVWMDPVKKAKKAAAKQQTA
ncbi:MAG: ABC transporter permease subunit [Gloeocapsa sp. DLM2.Bin57]|nr:MAG: ABC transporter permease subunit [Gloeocapsa sp. DLM2.Bin57]